MFDDTELTFLAQVDEFAKSDIVPAAAAWSMGESPTVSMYEKASVIGLTGIEITKELGGLGLGFRTKAAAAMSLAMSVLNTHNVANRLCASAPVELRVKYLPALLNGNMRACTALTEPTVGSEFSAIKTTARKTNHGWVLNGEKKWIVNARHAELAIVFAQCNDIGDSDGIGAFLVDITHEGTKRYAIDASFSQTSIGTGGFLFKNVSLSEDRLLLPPGTAYKSILNEINGARTYVAAMCNGMLNSAIFAACSYGESRIVFGKPLAEHASWMKHIKNAEIDFLECTRLTTCAIQKFDSGQDSQLSAIQAKIATVDACQKHLPKLLHAMGAEGLLPQHCFTRHLAAAQMAALTDGATNLLRNRAAMLSQTKPV